MQYHTNIMKEREPGDKQSEPAFRELSYDDVLTIEEARERFSEVKNAVDKIKESYSGPLSRFKKNIKGEDMEVLEEGMGVLLPLSLQKSVQEELVKMSDETEGALFYLSSSLQQDILIFAAKFKNPGITLVRGKGSLEF
jgi:hypothetical protein